MVDNDRCLIIRGDPPIFNLTFGQLCNRILERMPDINNDTDESNCLLSEWSCKTHYSECNGIWSCPDGADELIIGCSGLNDYHCNGTHHFCLDIKTGSPICLSKEQAGDGIIHCVGSWDEQNFCRFTYFDKPQNSFRCRNSNICITYDQICDCNQDCPDNDDETVACQWSNNGQETLCDKSLIRCRSGYIFKGIVS